MEVLFRIGIEPFSMIYQSAHGTKMVQYSNLTLGFLGADLQLNFFFRSVPVFVARFPSGMNMVPNQLDMSGQPCEAVIVLGEIDIVAAKILELEGTPLFGPTAVQ